MKRLIASGSMFGNLIEVSSTTPLPQPLPARGRGGVGFVGLGAVLAVLSPPSPAWGGLGWGAVRPYKTR